MLTSAASTRISSCATSCRHGCFTADRSQPCPPDPILCPRRFTAGNPVTSWVWLIVKPKAPAGVGASWQAALALHSSALAFTAAVGRLELVKQSRRILHGLLQRHLNDLQSDKTLPALNGDVGGDDGHLRLGDVVLRKFVLDAHGALSLDFNLMSQLAGELLQLSCRHIRMGNSRRTGGHGNNPHRAASAGIARCGAMAFARLTESAVTNVPARIAIT